MSIHVRLEDLSDEVRAILLSFSEEVQGAVRDAAEAAGKETAQKLRETSPQRTGGYAGGWKAKKEAGGIVTVYNKDHYRLTQCQGASSRRPQKILCNRQSMTV